MTVNHRPGRAHYECSKSRADHVQTPRCSSVRADTVDEAVAARLLAALSPEEVELALAAAEEVTERRSRSNRAAELRVERARYEADRAERAFHACEPENRLVARSLEQRWEQKLLALAETETALSEAQAAAAPLPPPQELKALCSDLPGLWAAPTTSAKDRKRLLRTLIADVTFICEPGAKQLRVGIRWQSGPSEKFTVERPARVFETRRTPAAAVELARRRGPELRDEELAAELTAAGQLTGAGQRFDAAAVRWLRWRYRIPSPSLFAVGELSVREVAERLGVSDGAVYYWISHGQLEARRGPCNRLCVPFPPEVERVCRERVASSTHIATPTKKVAAGSAV